MGRKNETGSTKSAKTAVEKKQKKEKPAKLTKEEKFDKYGNKKETLGYKLHFKPMTESQNKLYDMVGDKIITLVKGYAGTGKSWTVFSKALKLLRDSDNGFSQILVLVPTQATEDIGYLPGGVQEKIEQATLADKYTIEKILNDSGNDGKEVLRKLISEEYLKFDCIAYWRGRTIDNKIVCISECSNLTPKNVKTALTRIGNSCYVLSGDPTQSDLPLTRNGKKQIDGLSVAFDKLKDVEEIGKLEFSDEDDIVRNPIIKKIIKAWGDD
jgi:PhoH-like ATPase